MMVKHTITIVQNGFILQEEAGMMMPEVKVFSTAVDLGTYIANNFETLDESK